MPDDPAITVLHYTGYDDDRGGIVAVIRALAETGQFACVLGANAGCVQNQTPPLPLQALPPLDGEIISFHNFRRARKTAGAVREWLRADPRRVFHGHSRAGLLVALWLHWLGERRVVVSVHGYGRQRWFYRWAARRLGGRLYWLSPAMRDYYGVAGQAWDQCVPGGVPDRFARLGRVAPEPGKLRLGGAGALVRWKRWQLVGEALALLPSEIRPGVSFEHIGSAPPDADSAAYAADLARTGMPGVTWRGAEPSSDRLLQGIDLYVVAAHAEPFSMAMQEALAAGVPVVAADSGGARDLIVPGKNGWLFRDGDARALATLLAERLRSGDWCRLDRTAIRQSAWPAVRVAARWREIYGEVIGPPGAAIIEL